MKIQLTLSLKYVRSWGIAESVREVVQNALDAKDDGHEMVVHHSGKTLKVTSKDVTLDKSVWLLGTSSKTQGGYRGQYGEGLNLAMLAGLRSGLKIKIINGSESWTPQIEPSETFEGESVLSIYTHKRKSFSPDFSVEMEGIDAEDWEMYKTRFLALTPPATAIDTDTATVLMDSGLKGKIFVKGIFVQNTELSYGYDFKNMSLDRDRRVVAGWDLRHHAANALSSAIEKQQIASADALSMMEQSAVDTEHMGDWVRNSQVEKVIAQEFTNKYGESAVPVRNMAAAREVEHFGKKGIVVPESLAKVLESQDSLNAGKVKDHHRTSATKTYSWVDFSDTEKETYTRIIPMVERASVETGFGMVENRLQIVEFGDPAIQGLYRDGKVLVSRVMLADPSEFLATLVHEVAHAGGGDGTVGHERAEAKIFCALVLGK